MRSRMSPSGRDVAALNDIATGGTAGVTWEAASPGRRWPALRSSAARTGIVASTEASTSMPETAFRKALIDGILAGADRSAQQLAAKRFCSGDPLAAPTSTLDAFVYAARHSCPAQQPRAQRRP
jgi:hypothetical protein